ncbi:MAG: carboxypeptidase regulatory-like domain-containing protein [Terriglobales bacterium]
MLRLHRLRTWAICWVGCIFLIHLSPAHLSLAQLALAQTSLGQTATKPPGSKASQNVVVTVTDENDVAVPSAFVYLQASPQGVALRCVTDFAGRCEFSNLSAATYQLRVEKQGFYSAMLPAIETGIAANVAVNAAVNIPVNIDVTLSHQQELREEVDVVESPAAIDPAQVAAQQTLSGLDVLNIPFSATHDYRNVLNYIPGVVQDVYGQPHVAGAETYQTVTLLDGFNITQPANGQLLARISTDAFRSIQVEPAREPAEFGKGSGGLLMLNTGIGNDHFRFYATDFVPSFQDKGGWRFDQILPRLTFSGPLEKGKVWFYNALDGEFDNVVYTELPADADYDHVLRIGNLAKLQANVTSRHIVTASFLVNHLDDKYSGLSPQNPQLSSPRDVESAYLASVKDQYYFKGGELLETGLAFDQYKLKWTPYGTSPYFIIPETYGDTASGSYYLSAATLARRWQALSNLFLAPRHWHGRHDLKFGADFDRLIYDAQFARQPISFLRPGQSPLTAPNTSTCLTLAPAMNPCSLYSTFSGGLPSSTYNFEASAYAQDRWLIGDRLLVESGLRLDWDEIIRSPLLSPRLAGTYVLDNSGNTKLSAGIGLVYDPTFLFLIARPFAGQRTDYFFDTSGAATGTVLTTFSVDRNALQAPRFINWSLGLERKLPAAIYLKAEFLEKRGSRGFDFNTPSGSGGNFILENTRDDRYDAFEVSLRHNFRESYMLMGSYTRSRLHSNQALDFSVDNSLLGPQQPGPYSWDTPNRFLSWGYLPLPKLPIIRKTEIAYSMETRTGFPFNVTNDQQQLVGPPGSRRFPDFFSLNLYLEKRFHLFGYFWELRGGLDNITDHSNPLVVNSDINSPQFLTFSAFEGRAFTSRIRLLGRK